MSSTPINNIRDIRHPAEDRWTALAAGLAAKPEADHLLAHAAECAACARLLREALEFLADEPTENANTQGANTQDGAESAFLAQLKTSAAEWREATAAKLARPPRRAFPVWLPLAAALVLVAGGALWWSLRPGPAPETLLAKAYTEARPFEYRLPDAGYGPVRQQRGAGSAFDRSPALVSAEAEIARRLDGHPDDARLLALKGRAELLEGKNAEAIASLSRALELKPGDPDFTADLGVAYALGGDNARAIGLFHDAEGAAGRSVRSFQSRAGL